MIKSQLPSTPNGKLPDPFESFIYGRPEEDATESKDPHILTSSPFQPVLLPDPDSPMPFPGPITRSSFSSPKAMEESPTRICLSRRSSDTSENSCQSHVEARALRSFSTLNAASTLLDLASSPTISSIWTPQNELYSPPRKSSSSPFSSPQRQTSTFPWPVAKPLSTYFLAEEEFANSQSSSADYSAFSSSPLVSTPSSARALFSSSPNVKFGLWDMAKYVTSVSPIQRHGERPKSPESPTHSAQGGDPEKPRFCMKRQTDTSLQDVAQLSPLSSLSSSASSSPSIGHGLGGISSRSRSSGPRTFPNINRIPSIASRIQKLTGRLCRSESQDLSLSPFHSSVVGPPNGAEQKGFVLKDWQQTPPRTRLRSSRAVMNSCASTSLNVPSIRSESPNSYMPNPRSQAVTRPGVKNTKRSKRTLPPQDTGRLPNISFPALKKPRLDSAPHSAPLTPSTQAPRSSIAASPINDLVDVLEAPNNTVTVLNIRTFPSSIPIHNSYPQFYRRFPVPSFGCSINGETEGKVELAGATPNASRSPFDLYTPRFVKGRGATKVGLCPLCVEPISRGGEGKKVWLSMKFSAFNYHMQYAHGISPAGKTFSPPTAFRHTIRVTSSKHEKTSVEQGMCHKCRKWVNIEGIKDVDVKVPEIYWWKHAATCHQGSIIQGERNIFLEDQVYLAANEAG